MKHSKITRWASIVVALSLAMALLVGGSVSAFDLGGKVLLSSHSYTWTDPVSGGQANITQNVYEGVEIVEPDGTVVFVPHDMTWEYVVTNLSYDPEPGITNGFSGFQLLFPGPVPELYNQQSPAVGGPWQQNAFSGQFPPFGVEWDAALPGAGIMPGQTGTFSFSTFERMDVIVEAEGVGQGPAGWAHTWGLSIPEPIIDADGNATATAGNLTTDVEVTVGDLLSSWPTGSDAEGLDWFDNDGDGNWTAGDDLHVEGPAFPTALRDGFHDDNPSYFDPLILDLDLSLVDGQQVDVDLETGTAFGGHPGLDPRIKFFDTNGVTNWDNGEDIVLDVNLDGIFGEVFNTQTYIHHGWISIPGVLLNVLGIESSAGFEINKKVKYMDDDGNGIIEAGERVDFLQVIQVHNPTGDTWTDVTVKDRFGAEIDVTSVNPTQGTVTLTTKGKSEKEFLEWGIGDLAAGETVNLVLYANTDLNPAGKQEYSEPGAYEFNSGVVLKVHVDGKQRSFETGSIMVTVLP
jgi:hypothetical protein